MYVHTTECLEERRAMIREALESISRLTKKLDHRNWPDVDAIQEELRLIAILLDL
ncbi:MAG: hypothetical protein DDT23_01060 [candidate division WS2 bacterium]|nr:hypothetical protein [Candidatus Lithacetigena glycinireducens]